jgi:acylphosphatase
MSRRCLRGHVSGRVQGVRFRAFAREQALAAGVTGYARNLADGRVEVLLCGEEEAAQRVVAALHRGPPAAQVSAVELQPVERAEPGEFSIG